MWAAQADLDPGSRHTDDRVAGHFGAAAGRSGNGHKGQRPLQQGLPATHHLQIVEQVTLVGGQCGDGLARVHGTASAQPDHGVAALAPNLRPARGHRFHRGLVVHDQNDRLDGSGSQQGAQTIGAWAWQVGRHQGAAHSLGAQGSGHLRQLAGTKQQPRSGRELEAHHVASSVTLRYFVLVRGWAIMDATVSRHF